MFENVTLPDGLAEVKRKVRADGGLRCRWSPYAITKAPLNIRGLIPDGEVVLTYPQTMTTSDGLRWVLSLSSVGWGWTADQYLLDGVEDDDPQPVPVPIKRGNRLGWHLLPGTPQVFLDMAKQLQQANRPIPLVVAPFITDGRNAFTVQQLRSAGVKTIIARIFTGNDYHAEDKGGWNKTTRADGREYFERNKVLITPDIASADFVQIRDLNEPGEGVGINEWMHGMLDGANAMGIKVCVYNFSVGNPSDLGFWRWASTVELLRRVKREGHAFCLHQYAYHDQWTDEWLMMRHLRIMPLLPADLQDIPIYLNEFGESKAAAGTPRDRSPVRYRERMRTAQGMLSGKYNVKGAAMWTLGDSGGWAEDRLEIVLPDYKDFALEVAA